MFARRLSRLRQAFEKQSIDAYFALRNDPHNSEYLGKKDDRVAWLSGFGGSNASILVGKTDAVLWTDSRYWLEAEQYLDSNWKINRQALNLAQELPDEPQTIGFDPWTTSTTLYTRQAELLSKNGHKLISVTPNLIDDLRDDLDLQSGIPNLFRHEHTYRTASDKLQILRADSTLPLLLTNLDDIAWVLNLRGRGEFDYNPIFTAYLLIEPANSTLYIANGKVSEDIETYLAGLNVSVREYDSILDDLIQVDGEIQMEKSANYGVFNLAKQPKLADSPVLPHRGIKDEKEIEGFRQAWIQDGVALCQFFAWLSKSCGTVTEYMASQKLSELRSSRPEFHSLSFEAIAAYGANGAIVHYRCGEDSPIIDDQSMFLLDSGSQYRHGTTDVTRTVHLGTPTDDQIEAYTRVLMGHIDLALARWPSDRGLTGSDLDSLARQHLWQGGLDYLHGTGHGVGSFLGVHEGPHNISHKSRTVQLQPNMITTNEPGYYKEGQWGIRIENMQLIRQTEDQKWLYFDTLTKCPYAVNLIDTSLLSSAQKNFINSYHESLRTTLGPMLKSLDTDAYNWLQNSTRPIGDNKNLSAFYEFEVDDIDGKTTSMSDYKGKLLLIVNVASRWGKTKLHYEQLVSLYNDYKERDFEILAFPCNQFGSQESKPNDVIKEFTREKGVTFSMFSKIDVNDKKKDAHPMFSYLRENSTLKGADIRWNFGKFLVSKTGDVIGYYDPSVRPFDMKSEIEAHL